MRRAGSLAGAVGILAAVTAIVPAVAGAAGMLTPEDVPGLKRAGGGKNVARKALPARPPATLRKAATQGAAFRADDRNLAAGVFTLRSESAAKKSFRPLERGGRDLELGDGAVERSKSRRGNASATVAVRVGQVIGAVRFDARLSKDVAADAARAYAGLLVGRIQTATAWDRALAEAENGGSISSGGALRAFAIAYGPIPGVKRPKAPIGGTEPTLAAALVLRVWDQLSPEQRAAIEAKLDVSFGAGEPTRAAQRRSQRAITPNPQFQSMADFYAAAYATRLSMNPPNIKVFNESDPIAEGADLSMGATLAEALPVTGDGANYAIPLPAGSQTNAYCRIRVPPAGQAHAGTPGMENIIAHEVFHCFQFRLSQWQFQGVWLREGTASWAADTITGTHGTHYLRYLQSPTDPLFGTGGTPGTTPQRTRTYDANGFFGHADEASGAGSLWGKLPTLFGTTDNATAYSVTVGTPDLFVPTWASAMFRLDGPGPAWNQTDPYPLPFTQFPLPAKPVTTATTIGSSPYSTSPYVVGGNPSRPLVNVLRFGGDLRAANTSTDFGPVADSKWFCLARKCECPPGKASSIPPHENPGSLLVLGLTGGAGAGDGRVTFHDPKSFCDERDPNPDTGRPSGPGGTNGDPHMTSMDGLHYDFQAAGEFTLLRSDSGDINIQARQEPWLKSNRATINTQIAVGVEGHRVTVSAGSNSFEPPVLRIDGTADSLPPGQSRALGGGAVTRQLDDGSIEVTWPDGSNLEVRGVGDYGVAARVQLAGGRAGSVSGLLGDFDGNPANDLATPSGKRIRYTAKVTGGWPPLERFRPKEEYDRKFFDDLYDVVGDAWRIKQRESLFDYGPGETTKKFTDRSIPERPLDPAKIPARARAKAERICREAGVTEPGPLLDCIIDLYVTGRLEFAEDAAAEQEDASFTRLNAGADRISDLSLLETGDGALHIGFEERTGSGYRSVNVPVSASGVEFPAETIASRDTAPFLFAAPDGSVRAESAELRSSEPSGIYQYGRAANGTWSDLGPVATSGNAYAGKPSALFASGTLFSVSSTGVARIFRGSSPSQTGSGVSPTAGLPDCYSTSPALARDDATGELWIAWVQWDCPQQGVFVQQIDRSTGQLVGSPIAAPGTAGNYIDVSIGEPLAFTGRPGQPGVYLAHPTADGANVSLWKVGEPAATTIPSLEGDAGFVDLEADPAGGRLWLAWSEGDRLVLGRSDGGPLIGAARPLDPPRGVQSPLFTGYHWDVAARPGGLDVLYGYPRSGDIPGGIWHTLIPAG